MGTPLDWRIAEKTEYECSSCLSTDSNGWEDGVDTDVYGGRPVLYLQLVFPVYVNG